MNELKKWLRKATNGELCLSCFIYISKSFVLLYFSLNVFSRITLVQTDFISIVRICAKVESTGYQIMRTAACTFLLFAFGVANATEDQFTDGKHIHP